ncbi:hypothetical protein J2Z76_000155 [Sedimentibacter acidaminivorans]|uniref:Uncharacterized protein n=1 Tax=Sedimentibacter acidaminivorans TaxID=913099 RepID=A0ABS4G9D9_9FIRM|nr:hypothetical protein [Sedimentibacter acidaminivorans]MBP1924302.1 hypothetical protein [Sedimentibacter acidaminivorans]
MLRNEFEFLIRTRYLTYYVRLTSEAWYYIKKECPNYWNSKNILISADFEIFIPYNYNHEVIFLLDRYGELIDNDYFLVYKIDFDYPKNDLLFLNMEDFQILIKELKNKSLFIPQVVEYEFNKYF